jgi:hypothetical protein
MAPFTTTFGPSSRPLWGYFQLLQPFLSTESAAFGPGALGRAPSESNVPSAIRASCFAWSASRGIDDAGDLH